MVSSLYIHIPFCVRKCVYCDFLSIPYDGETASRYAGALCTELSLVRASAGPLRTVYMGGGTPTLLGLDDFSQIFERLRRDYTLIREAEITAEANPGTIDSRILGRLHDLGVNRLSLGVQSFDDPVLKTLGRIHSASEAAAAAEEAQRAGFRNISLDLMYGIPGQTMTSWKETLSLAVDLGPSHISAYELTPEKSTPLFSMLSSGTLSMPDEDLVLGMYDNTIDFLASHGFRHYEISNFALPGLECRHNLNYWERGEYLGIGAGAHSFIEGLRCRNNSDIAQYTADILRREVPRLDEQQITPKEAAREFIFLGVRRTEGISMTSPLLSGFDLAAATRNLEAGGYLETDGLRFRLTRKGIVISNTVIVELLNAVGL